MCDHEVVTDVLEVTDHEGGHTYFITHCGACGARYGSWGDSHGQCEEWVKLESVDRNQPAEPVVEMLHPTLHSVKTPPDLLSGL